MAHDGLSGPIFDAMVRQYHADENARQAAVQPYSDAAPVVSPGPASLPFGPLTLPLVPIAPGHQGGSLRQRAAAWLVSRTGIQTTATSLGVPSLVWVVAEVSAAQSLLYTGGAAGAAIGIGTALTLWSLDRGFGPKATLAGAGMTTAGVQIAMSSAPSVWSGFVGWLISAAGCAALRVTYANGRKEPDAKVRILEGQARLVDARTATEMYKAQAQVMKLQAHAVKAQMDQLKLAKAIAAAEVPQDPYFPPTMVGRLQRAVWKATGIVTPVASYAATATGWTAELLLTDGLTMRMVSGKADQIAETLGLDSAPSVAYGSTRDYLLVTYRERGEFPQVIGYTPDWSDLPWDAPVRLGVDEYGDQIVQALTIHCIVAGATGGGKSNCLNLICLQLAQRRHVELIGIDLKPGTPEMRPLMPILSGLADDLFSAHEVLDSAISEMYRRGRVMAETGAKKWDPERHGAPVRYIVMDEYAELIRTDTAYIKSLPPEERREWDSVKGKVETLAALSRFVGIFLIMGTQTPDGTLFGDNTAARTNFPIRIVFRLMEQIHYRFALPAEGEWTTALSSKSPGRFIVYSPDHDEPEMYLAYRVADDPRDAALGLDPDQLRQEVERISRKRLGWGYTPASA